MHVIILAAGVGNRLGASGQQPKSLLNIGGRSLLARHLDVLARHKPTKVTICVGYQEELIRAAASHSELSIECVTNSNYRRGSVVSLWTARETLTCGDEVLVMDADVLYTPRIVERLVASQHQNCFLLDRDFIPGDEPVKLCVRDGQLVEFRKRPDPSINFDFCGESVGFFRFSSPCAADLARRCDAYITAARMDEPYEEPIRDLVLARQQTLGFEDISGMPWVEIDFPEDIDRAEREIAPQILGELN
jgi:choline kinase